MPTFSVIATPIGNLEDITIRALKVLANADLILCEDTRVTRKLLDRHGIKTKTLSYHTHSKISRVEEIIGLLKEACLPARQGKNIALVSDAGTPGISDPGSELVRIIRKEFEAPRRRERILDSRSDEEDDAVAESGALKIETIPGPSALTAALSIAGVPCADFTFLGFLPHKKGRQTLFKEIAQSKRTMVFYESPHRIMKTLEVLATKVTPPPSDEESPFKRVTICRELTKIFEEVVSGSANEVKEYFEKNPDKVRGEFVVIVSE